MKKRIAVLVSTLALVAMASMAQAATTRFAVQDTNAADKMVVQDNGYIGIGVASPGSPVHIDSTKLTPFITGATNAYRIDGNEVTNGAGFVANNNRANSVPPQVNDRLGFIFFGSAYNGSPINPAGFFAKVDSTWTATSTPAFFDFLTTPVGSLTRNVRMRIGSNGNVGIGGAGTNGINATQKLEVDGGVRLNTATTQPACDANARGTLWVVQGATDVVQVCLFSGATGSWKTIAAN